MTERKEIDVKEPEATRGGFDNADRDLADLLDAAIAEESDRALRAAAPHENAAVGAHEAVLTDEIAIPAPEIELFRAAFENYKPIVPSTGLRTDRDPRPVMTRVPSGVRETVTNDGVTIWDVTVHDEDGPRQPYTHELAKLDLWTAFPAPPQRERRPVLMPAARFRLASLAPRREGRRVSHRCRGRRRPSSRRASVAGADGSSDGGSGSHARRRLAPAVVGRTSPEGALAHA